MGDSEGDAFSIFDEHDERICERDDEAVFY
jgi:hypothetical protein